MKFKMGDFLSELLLYSGQYALFYILMNFSKSGLDYFNYSAHTVLIIALLIQTLILYKYGDRAYIRILGGLICPFIYTVFEIKEFNVFILNIGHLFFWGFSIVIGILNVVKNKSEKRRKLMLEFITVFMNIVIFIFVYMYFDISLSQAGKDAKLINEYSSSLSILNIASETSKFFKDEAHIYITLGGILLGINLGISQVRVLKLKEKINDLFGKYIDDTIRDKLIKNNGVYKEKRELSVLFCDIRNFTTISENLESTIIIDSLNQYFTMWDDIASKHGGIINKYIGDAVMIIFGLTGNINHENDSVNCSIEVLNSLENLNNQLKINNLVSFDNIGIGIHRGELVIGNVGSENRREFTVIGDIVNTASRLESHTKLIDENLIISSEVYDKLDNKLKEKFDYLDLVLLKGKESGVKIYNLKKLLDI